MGTLAKVALFECERLLCFGFVGECAHILHTIYVIHFRPHIFTFSIFQHIALVSERCEMNNCHWL